MVVIVLAIPNHWIHRVKNGHECTVLFDSMFA